MQITIDVDTLTTAQRLHIAQFITNYPNQDDDATSQVQPFSFQSPEVDDDEEPSPSPDVSFGMALVPPVPISPPTTTGVTLDKAGLPWDERIHSSNKALVADGTWRKRRGVDDAVVAQVEAELKAIMGIPAPLVSSPSAVATQPVVPPPPPAPVAVATNLPSPIPSASTVEQTTPAAPVASSPNAYLNLIQLVTDVVTKKQMTKAQIEDLIASVDPSLNLQLLSKRPDLIPQITANIRTLAA